MDRLFLDANILFSAAYRAQAGLRRLWELGDIELVTSSYALEEARVNLQEPRQRERLEQLADTIRIIASFVNRPLPEGVTLPDKDRPILLAAIDAQATHPSTAMLVGHNRLGSRQRGSSVTAESMTSAPAGRITLSDRCSN